MAFVNGRYCFGEPRKFVGQVMMFEGCWWIDNGTAVSSVMERNAHIGDRR
ncbi:hypothetical protein ACT7DD_31345 [Bacillus paranthracis]